jgi:hypothetical protein
VVVQLVRRRPEEREGSGQRTEAADVEGFVFRSGAIGGVWWQRGGRAGGPRRHGSCPCTRRPAGTEQAGQQAIAAGRCTCRRGGRAAQQPGLDTAVAARARHMPPWRSCRSAARPRPRRRTPASLQSPAAALQLLLRSRPLSDGSFGWGALHYQLFYSIYFFQEHLFTSTTHHMCFFSFACNERQLDGSVARAQRLCNQQGVNYSLIRVLLTRCYSCYNNYSLILVGFNLCNDLINTILC